MRSQTELEVWYRAAGTAVETRSAAEVLSPLVSLAVFPGELESCQLSVQRCRSNGKWENVVLGQKRGRFCSSKNVNFD